MSGEDQADRPQWEEGLWPDPQSGPLRVRLWFGRVEGRPQIVGVELWGVDPIQQPWLHHDEGEALDVTTGAVIETPRMPLMPATGIGAENVRLPLGRLLDEWVDRQRAFARASRKLFGDVPGHQATVDNFEQGLDGKSVGRPRLSDEKLQRVTDVYNTAVAEGDRNPALRVQQELGAAVSDTARSWVRQARLRGFPVLPSPRRKRQK